MAICMVMCTSSGHIHPICKQEENSILKKLQFILQENATVFIAWCLTK